MKWLTALWNWLFSRSKEDDEMAPELLIHPDTGEAVLDFYHGDPAVIAVKIPGDMTSRTYSAVLKQRAANDAEVLATWAIETSYDADADETTITMELSGDSAPGVRDGLSRRIPTRKAVTDLQEMDTNGRALRTPVRAVVVGVPDVTQ